MKANETPEKIYLRHNHKGDIGAGWLIFPLTNNDIEYVRTDAFIEKACSWIKESISNNPECNRIISKKGVITVSELIKDFKNYMKGE